MRMLVTSGTTGQLARALCAEASATFDIVSIGRPELDLSAPDTLAAVLQRIKPDIVVNAAAYTQVDKAEEEEHLAMIINGEAAGSLAKATRELGIPIIQISTDYVFDGKKHGAYVEEDAVAPLNAYGRSKLAGEQAVAAANPRHAILRTSWVYDAHGKNFLNTMLRLAQTRNELRVVADQRGAPSYAPDLARAILAVAAHLTQNVQPEHYGVFHMTGGGETSWAGFAEEIFRLSAQYGGDSACVIPISTSDYPTPAKRPSNSRLNCHKLDAVHDIQMPDWRDALARCMAGLQQNANENTVREGLV